MSLAESNAALGRRAARLFRRTEREVLKNYKVVLDRTRGILAGLYEKYAKDGELTHAEMSKYNRLTGLEKSIQELRPVLRENGKAIKRLSAEVYEDTYFRSGYGITQEVGVDLRWGTISPDVVKAAVENPISGLSLTQLTAEEARRTLIGVNRAVTQGLVQGDSYARMAKRVKGFLDGDAGRAITVVRTEGQRAYAAGQIAAYDRAEKLGVGIRRVWDATLDGRTRPSHGDMDGQAAGDDGLFDAGAYGRIPGPLHSGYAEFDINCRCAITPEVEGFDYTRVRGQGYDVKKQTYTEWQKAQG